MGIVEQAKAMIERITSDVEGFGIVMTFTAPTGEVAVVAGTRKKHHLGVDQNTGVPMNSKTASVSVSERFLTEALYPVRNAKGIVNLKGHLVDVVDSTGSSEKFIVEQWFPDETIGLIVCTLGTYE